VVDGGSAGSSANAMTGAPNTTMATIAPAAKAAPPRAPHVRILTPVLTRGHTVRTICRSCNVRRMSDARGLR
jgi:hypothetical protein